MIFTDRVFLSILTLTEDRDYVTYDEMIHVLTERPFGRVYIERNGVLCGLITAGRIERRHDEKTRRIPFNKKFTAVHPGEHSRVWKILEKVNEVPVVSEDGRLLGEYTRWNYLLGTDYAELLCKDPYVLQGLKEDIQNVVFIEPRCSRGGMSPEMSLWWRQRFENKGIHLQVIQSWEIKDYRNTSKLFIFIDADEMIGFKVLNGCLYHQRELMQRVLGRCFTIIDYLNNMKQFASAHLNERILKELQNQGVPVLTFDFEENSTQFLAVLNERIKKRNDEYGVDSGWLAEELKESFLDELYCESYNTQKFPLPVSVHTQFGIPYLSDTETEFLHIHNGERLTVNQPEKYDRCIYLYGPCVVIGLYVSDQYTISSLLQSEINQAGFFCKVINHGSLGRFFTAGRLQSESFKHGDIVVLCQRGQEGEKTILDQGGRPTKIFPILNLTDALEKNDAPADWFVDNVWHCNHKANQTYAHAIYEELIPVLQQPTEERHPIELDFDYIDLFYLNHYFSDYDPASSGTVGSIVMNCNPFTLGHRFLIEEALKIVDFLIIFVVEEDESLFSFQERFAMICQGTSDLERVMVVPSGPYILSKNTFPEYFQKNNDEDLKRNTEDDITLFAERIAPRLGITYRFVGEEREDTVTNEYNEAMKRILPRYGIQVVEIPRKTNAESVISASRVRYCLSMNHLEELDELIPPSTKRILFYEIK